MKKSEVLKVIKVIKNLKKIKVLKKLAIITTHPIQYQIPLFKNLKKYNIEPIVFYASRHGLKKHKIMNFYKRLSGI